MGRRHGAGAAGLGLVLLAACSGTGGQTSTARPAPPSDGVSTAVSGAVPLSFVGPSSPLLQDLWGPFDTLRRLDTDLPRRLDLAAIRRAPRLSEAPIGSAVLAVGSDPAPYDVGEPAVVSAEGEWRLVDRTALGMRDPAIVEQQVELSPDGRTLALGDEHGVVFVHLATGTATRVGTPVEDPVLHAWTPGSRGVLVTRRGGGDPSWEVTVADRGVTRVPYDVWTSSMGADGRLAELVPVATEPRSRRSFTDVRLWRDDITTGTQPLRVGVPQEAFVAKQWSSLVGVRQQPSTRMGTAGGIGALDPATGEMAGFLPLPRRQLVWASVAGALGDRWLLVTVASGPGGGILAWDPVRRQLRGVTAIDARAATRSLAGAAALR